MKGKKHKPEQIIRLRLAGGVICLNAIKRRTNFMKKACVFGVVLLLCLNIYALYAMLNFGWLLSTPLNARERSRIQYDQYAWTAVFVVAAILVPVLIVLMKKFDRK